MKTTEETLMKIVTRIAAATAVIAVSVFAAPVNAAYNLTLCGASPGGLWSLLGAGIDAAVSAAQPGSTVTYQTSGGGFANIGLLQQGKCDLAIVHDAEAIVALNGGKPFKAPVKNLRTVAVLYTWAPMQLIVKKDFADKHGLKSLEDIGAKKAPVRILLNKRGNVASQVGESMLEASGVSVKDIEAWGGSVTFAASKEQGELMRDRRADAILNSLFINHRSIRQLANAIDLSLLPISAETSKAVRDEWKINAFTIPATAYSWAPAGADTVALSAQLFVLDNSDEKMVGDVTSALIEHVDKLKGVHKAMKPLTTELMGSSKAVTYHPAADSAYKAAGLR